MSKIMKFKKLLIAILVIGMSVAAVMPQLLAAVSARPGTWDRGIIPEIEKTVNGGAHLDLVNRDDVFTWEVKTDFQYGGANHTQLIITDEVNPLLDILSVSVKDAYGDNAEAWGNLVVNDVTNVITFEFTTNPVWDSIEYLNSEVFTMFIETKIKESASDEDLAPYMEANGITNMASVTLSDGSSVLSNEVTVMLSAPNTDPAPVTPIDPEIVSTVNGGTHLDLVNRDDVFNLTTNTSFGNQGENWTQLIITDEVNLFLDILNVSVVNALGENVEQYGNLYVDPVTNVIPLELYAVDGNFKLINDEFLTILVETKIKDSATDEDLAPYLAENGILHNARLNYGDGSDSIVSETVTVMPPSSDQDAPIVGDTPTDIDNPANIDTPNTPGDSKLPNTGIANSVVGALLLLLVSTLVTVYATINTYINNN